MATKNNSLTGLYQALQIQIDEGKAIESPDCAHLIEKIKSKHHFFDKSFLGKKVVSQWYHPQYTGNFIVLEDKQGFYWVDSIIKDKGIKGKVTLFAYKEHVHHIYMTPSEVNDYVMDIVYHGRYKEVTTPIANGEHA
ncbi:MAG: hypothetical protein U9N57_01125 [Pseudomonadota bacterium]|nr:hypothetical protein [Pseudomonadota bacterium]